MGLETVALISGGIQLAQGFMSYRSQKQADKEARRQAEIEASIIEQDAKRAAKEELEIARRERAKQKTLFLKSGVMLQGSPLLVMEETREKGAENAKNTVNSAQRRADLVRRKGSVQRADLTGTLFNTAGNLADTYQGYQSLKQIQ